MSRELKQIEELKEGNCKVVVLNKYGKNDELDGTLSIYDGIRYVFCVVEHGREILGYIQE